jgi:pimeloyl-ACP methyl ester carboxylesterase
VGVNQRPRFQLPPECIVRLADGRRVGVAEYGEPDGTVVVALHGMPGSRLMFATLDGAARRARIRLIALDRPGYGISDRGRSATLLEYADDVATVADTLGVGPFGILGASGGGPYALAIASRFPARVTQAGVVSGIGPLRTPGALTGMARANALIFRLSRFSPRLVGALLPSLTRQSLPSLEAAAAAGTSPTPSIPPEVLSIVVADQREAIRHGGGGIAFDAANLWRPWGFALTSLNVPVALWHGEADTLAPAHLARLMASEIPGASARFYPGEDHAEPLVRHPDEIVAKFQVAGSIERASIEARPPSDR